jgi:hypothetical protein
MRARDEADAHADQTRDGQPPTREVPSNGR